MPVANPARLSGRSSTSMAFSGSGSSARASALPVCPAPKISTWARPAVAALAPDCKLREQPVVQPQKVELHAPAAALADLRPQRDVESLRGFARFQHFAGTRDRNPFELSAADGAGDRLARYRHRRIRVPRR